MKTKETIVIVDEFSKSNIHYFNAWGKIEKTLAENEKVTINRRVESGNKMIISIDGNIGSLSKFFSFLKFHGKYNKDCDNKIAVLFLNLGSENNTVADIINNVLFSNLVDEKQKKNIKLFSSPEEAIEFVLN